MRAIENLKIPCSVSLFILAEADSPDTKDTTEWSVECDKKTSWSVMPKLPKNTVYLDIYKANIPALKPAAYDRGRKTLRTIRLNYNNVTTVDRDYFHGLDKLMKLELTDNKLRFFSNNTFEGNPNLMELKLSYNSFSVIPSKNICFLKKLQILQMASNKLTSGKFDKCFTELLHLYYIDISNNSIGAIQESDFESLRKSPVKELYMGNLGLEKLSSNIFKWLPRLRRLDIKSNELTYLQPDVFVHVPGLTSLNIIKSKLSNIPNAAIGNLIHLEYLDIQFLKLRPGTFQFQFQNLSNLTHLYIGHNDLYKLYNSTFAGLNNSKYIKVLGLDAGQLRQVEADSLLPFR